jgi:nucleotide-binding universal stress UspA family protein
VEIARILVPTDFSEGATVARDRAVALAKEHGATIHLFHGLRTLDVLPPGVEDAVEERARELLGERVTEIEAQGVACEALLLPGPALDAFEQAEDRVVPDLVVVGARGYTTLRRLWLGSFAAAVVRHAFSPVLIARGEPGPAAPFARILVATDFALDAAAAGGVAAALQPGASLFAAHVVPMPYDPMAAEHAFVERTRERARDGLAVVAAELGAEVDLLDGDPAEELVAFAAERGCDLIAIGARGEGGPGAWMHGSVAEKVLRLSHGNVLVVRHRGAGDEVRAPLREASLATAEAGLEPEDRESFLDELRDVRAFVEGAQTLEGEAFDAMREVLRQRLTALEAAHPKLAEAIVRAVQAVEQMGV